MSNFKTETSASFVISLSAEWKILFRSSTSSRPAAGQQQASSRPAAEQNVYLSEECSPSRITPPQYLLSCAVQTDMICTKYGVSNENVDKLSCVCLCWDYTSRMTRRSCFCVVVRLQNVRILHNWVKLRNKTCFSFTFSWETASLVVLKCPIIIALLTFHLFPCLC